MHLVPSGTMVPATTGEGLKKIRALKELLIQLPQEEFTTWHTLHAGIYSRTVLVKAGIIMAGVSIKIPTTLVLCGDASLTVGEDVVRVSGYMVVPAEANREQAIVAHSDTWVTMQFTTDAQTIEAAEEQFTDEAHLLLSRTQTNIVTITGV